MRVPALLLVLAVAGCLGPSGGAAPRSCDHRAEWVAPLPPSAGKETHWGQRVIADGGHVVLDRTDLEPPARFLWAFDAADGRLLWSRSFPDRASSHAVQSAGGLLLLDLSEPDEGGLPQSLQSRLVALDPATGATRWEAATGLVPDSLFASGDLLVAAGAWNVTAYALADGAVRWSVPAPDPRNENFGGAVLVDGLVVLQEDPSSLVALDAATGREAWRIPVPGRPLPLLAADGIVVLRGQAGLLAVEATTGKELWSRPPSPAVGYTPFGGQLGMADPGGNVTAVDLRSGRTAWARALEPILSWADWGSRSFYEPPRLFADADRLLVLSWQSEKPTFIGGRPRETHAWLLAADGATAWETKGVLGTDQVEAGETLVLQGGTRFWAGDAETGRALWECAFKDTMDPTPSVALAGGRIVAIGQDKALALRA
jgi:outer membrane protein assembly factor BamB